MTLDASEAALPAVRSNFRLVGPAWIAFSFYVGIGGAGLHFLLLWTTALFGRVTVPACIYAATCIAALAAWCIWGERRRRVDAFLAGVMTSAVLFAMPLILVLLPLGVFVWPFLVVPGLCLWIYGRSAALAFESADRGARCISVYFVGVVFAPALSGSVLFTAVVCSNTALERLRSNDPASADPWVTVCAPLIGNSELPGWIDAYDAQIAANTPESLARAERISDAHRRITGTALPLGDSEFLGPAY